MRYTKIQCTELTREMMEIMVAMLPEFGFTGMEETENELTGYAREEDVVLPSLNSFAEQWGVNFTLSYVEEQNWNALWESNFEPVILPGKVHVRASFHPILEGFPYEILITPKMSFGTGHHATTRMMMEAMLALNLEGRRVIDFGTGTGILAVFAEMLGAKEVLALDNDNWSVENAMENIRLNRCSNIQVHHADSLEQVIPGDMVLANINRHVLEEQFSLIQKAISPNGYLLISGLLQSDYEDMLKLYGSYFGLPVTSYEAGGWIAMLFKSPGL